MQHCSSRRLARLTGAAGQRRVSPVPQAHAKGEMRGRRSHGNVFIANLPSDLSEERLAEAFDPYGIVLSAEIARDPNTGARLRHGWVDIATERAAKAAIAGLHGTAEARRLAHRGAAEREAGAQTRPGAAAVARRRPCRG